MSLLLTPSSIVCVEGGGTGTPEDVSGEAAVLEATAGRTHPSAQVWVGHAPCKQGLLFQAHISVKARSLPKGRRC